MKVVTLAQRETAYANLVKRTPKPAPTNTNTCACCARKGA